MDLHLIPGAEPSDDERDALDALLGRPSGAWDGGARRMELDGHVAVGGLGVNGRRDLLLPALQAAQRRIGHVTAGALNYICRRLDVPPAEAYGVATFYALLAVQPRPPRVAHLCDDIACRIR
ncbi:MAG TPA: NAD(P)H-dependent oxidoreductase subunit E, partial [Candidatus Polarisedimenticolia bacterium]|nr:NAD(P)H-dependent oxidoreductase subunit E [Candidatus Polarisedimenticolia bacterium]